MGIEISVSVRDFPDIRVVVEIPKRDQYDYMDMQAIAEQASNSPVPKTTLDYWIDQSGIVQPGRTARTSLYGQTEIEHLLFYLAHKRAYSRNSAYPRYKQAIKEG